MEVIYISPPFKTTGHIYYPTFFHYQGWEGLRRVVTDHTSDTCGCDSCGEVENLATISLLWVVNWRLFMRDEWKSLGTLMIATLTAHLKSITCLLYVHFPPDIEYLEL